MTPGTNNLRSLLLAGVLLAIAIWAHDLTLPRQDATAQRSEPIALPNPASQLLPENLFAALPQAKEQENHLPIRREGIPDIILDARAAFAMTEDGKVLYQKNAEESLPIASISKLMTALVALDQAPLETVISISAHAIKTEGDSGFVAGEAVSLHDAVLGTLVASSNDAAAAIAEHFGETTFLDHMNAKAGDLGMTTTHFANPHGLAPPGNTASAKDAAYLMQAALRDEFIKEAVRQEKVSFKSIEGRTHTFSNTDILLSRLPGALGGKTGFTMESQGTLAFAFSPVAANENRALRKGESFVVTVVLGSTDRFADTEALARWLAGAYQWR